MDGYETRSYPLAVSAYDPSEIRSFSADLRVVFADRSGAPNSMRPVIFGSQLSSEQLLSLSDADLLARFMAGYMEMMSKRSGAAPIQISSYTVLGHVDEPPDLAHVVARVTVKDESISVTALRVFTVRKIDGQWRGQLDESAKALLTKLRADVDRNAR